MGLLWLCWRMQGVHGFSAPTCTGCWVWERKMGSLHWYLTPQILWLGVSKGMFFQGYSLCSARAREKALLITSPPDVQGIPCFAFAVNFLNAPCIPVQPDAPHKAAAALLHMVCVDSMPFVSSSGFCSCVNRSEAHDASLTCLHAASSPSHQQG